MRACTQCAWSVIEKYRQIGKVVYVDIQCARTKKQHPEKLGCIYWERKEE